MRIIEATVSVSRKVPLEQYGGEEFFAALKAEVESDETAAFVLEALLEKAREQVERQAEDARARRAAEDDARDAERRAKLGLKEPYPS